MSDLVATERVFPRPQTSAVNGDIRIDWTKALWLMFHGVAGCVGVFLYPQIDGLVVFIALMAITICAGHSVGMHRLLIHRSFRTHRWLEYVLVWLGTLVGMAGPSGMIRAHDLRDWHQRQTACPPHPSHGAGFWRDAWWQLCCVYRLHAPPRFVIESEVAEDPVYRWMDRTWMLQQIPLAALLYLLGGWAWVLWGCSLRVFVSLSGHWMVGHFAHRCGQQDWVVAGLPVQGYNLPGLGLITFGENWHGNHHAFPHSARLGIAPGQRDPGFVFINCLERLGLVWDVQGPDDQPRRGGLTRMDAPTSSASRAPFSAPTSGA
ncbi:acyl-CoA desaturase [Yoonia sp. 2307UL14-13]|uniref:acyl-CoA desaturase n=1 Tax=Yoonia sp. 2307UL14-13 TaxID=3126506 RepID=UPI00309A1A91